MRDEPKKTTLEEFIATHPELVEAYDAAARADRAAGGPQQLETAKERQARITKQIEDISMARYAGIINACEAAGNIRLAPRYIRSGKSALMVEYELAKAAGRVH